MSGTLFDQEPKGPLAVNVNPFAKKPVAVVPVAETGGAFTPAIGSRISLDPKSTPAAPSLAKPVPANNAVMVFDFETVPDESRFPRPKFDPDATLVPDLQINGFFGIVKTVPELTAYLAKNPLSQEQYNALVSAENDSQKPRSGAIEALTKTRDAAIEAFDVWKKEASVNPFKARIVAFGFALGSHAVETMTATNDDEERAIVKKFYELIATGRRRAGYNILNFDDLLVTVRGMVLGVTPTVKLSRKKYGNSQALDLMQYLFPNGNAQKLKDVCAWLGITVPAGLDMDGSKVFDLYHAGQMEKIRDYVASDVCVERELMWRLLEVFSE